LRYSLCNENAIDLVLFLNGIPVATVELKTDFTQRVEDAVDQYRFDRQPRPKGQSATEPLLDFPRGALVHFAASSREVRMTTRLLGAATSFLPFNRGDHGGAGNPVNENGHRTAYLWEEVWARDSWLEIVGRYLVTRRDSKKQVTGLIFPRYHQLAATRQLQRTILAEGPGQKYLIQHSAGSGKTTFLPICTTPKIASCSTRCWSSPTAPCWTANCRKQSSTFSAPPAWWRRLPARRRARVASWRRRCPAARRSSSAPFRPFRLR
jgi:type I site-specific restriction-modification system R (restriction) subunit